MKENLLIFALFNCCVILFSLQTEAQDSNNRTEISRPTRQRTIWLAKDGRIDTLKFRLEDEGVYCSPVNLNLFFLDLDNNKSNVEQIEVIDDDTRCYNGSLNSTIFDLEMYWFNMIDGIVESVVDCSYNVMGEDGKSIGIWTFSYVTLYPTQKGHGDYLMRPDIVNPIKEFAESNRNNGAVTVKTVNKDLIVGRRLKMSTLRSLPSWMEDIYKKDYNFGKVLKEIGFNTDMGDYTIELYSSDGNDSNCEAIIIKRSDGLKCKLDGLREYKASIVSPDFYQGEYAKIGCIDVSWPGVGEFTILDGDLYGAFDLIKQKYPDVGKAFYIKTDKTNFTLTKSGNLLD